MTVRKSGGRADKRRGQRRRGSSERSDEEEAIVYLNCTTSRPYKKLFVRYTHKENIVTINGQVEWEIQLVGRGRSEADGSPPTFALREKLETLFLWCVRRSERIAIVDEEAEAGYMAES